jgi:hypothetical protein
MKNRWSWLYGSLLWATLLLLIVIPVFFIYMLFFDPSEGGIPAKKAHGNQPTEATTDEAAEVVTDCTYISTDSDREFGSHGSCGTLDKTGLLHFNKQALDKVDWSNFYGMECIHVKTNKEASSGWYFLTQEGLGRKTITADNGCLPFQKGLAVGWVDGKIAYYDRMMKIVHQTDYAPLK